jgi:putative OPT family oligopeptide transporter
MAAAQPAPPQLTIKAVLLGIALSVTLAGANAYLGLFAGMTVSASIPAAVISMGLLRLFGNTNILENNIVQTAASAGESLAAGIIFTLPALIILGYWETFDYWWVFTIAGAGGLLGVLFTVPLRRSLIVEQQLAFPEGVATAEVLKVGNQPGRGLRVLGFAAFLGAGVKFAETGLRLWPGVAQSATTIGTHTIAYIGTNLSPALLSVGYIVGLNIAVLVFLGGAMSWYIAIPIYTAFFMADNPAYSADLIAGFSTVDLAFDIWSGYIRYMGVGAMLVGGIWALISMRSSLLSGIRSGLLESRTPKAASPADTEKDVPMPYVLSGIALFVIPIFALYLIIVDDIGIGLAMTVIMVIASFLFSSVAAYMAGLVGSSNNPISGITIATILFASLVLLAMMGSGGAGPAAAIMIGAVVCCSAAIAGDNMQDLKAGYIVGATPWKQQLMQGVGVISAICFMAPILNLLLHAYGIGVPTPDKPEPLLAPQATLMASVAKGVFGGGLPWGMVAIGAGIGIAIIILDEILRRRGSTFRTPVLAVAVGIYLPLELSVPILAGGLISHAACRGASNPIAMRHGPGMLFAAGLITGEALLGILLALPIVITGDTEFMALPADWRMNGIIGLAVIGIVAALLYRTAIVSRD